MGGCLSSPEDKYATGGDTQALRDQVAQLQAQLNAKNAGGPAGTYAAAAGGGGGAAAGEVASLKQQVQSLNQQLADARKGGKGGGIADVLFFPDTKGLPCHNARRPGGCRRPNCTFAHEPTSLSKFLDYLHQATKTLDICVFTITCDDISDVVIELHKKGVKVRVITDNDQAATTGSDIDKFRAAGIQVRQDSSPTHMHHKFCILDGRLLMGGSFNWTRQAVLGNQENIVILDNASLISRFQTEYERLWNQFRP